MADEENLTPDSGVKENPSVMEANAATNAKLESFNDAHETVDSPTGFDLILDIPVTISMEVGRANLNVRKLLQLTQGSIIELERLAGEPLDVMVNGTLIAHGEVVVVNEKFGIRLTDIMSQAERIQKLK